METTGASDVVDVADVADVAAFVTYVVSLSLTNSTPLTKIDILKKRPFNEMEKLANFQCFMI